MTSGCSTPPGDRPRKINLARLGLAVNTEAARLALAAAIGGSTVRAAIQRAADEQQAQLRLLSVTPPDALTTVAEEARRRGQLYGSTIAGAESVYQDIITLRWQL